jgi:hypothetical protein
MFVNISQNETVPRIIRPWPPDGGTVAQSRTVI